MTDRALPRATPRLPPPASRVIRLPPPPVTRSRFPPVAEVSGNTEQSPDNDVSSSTSTPTQEKRKLDNKESSLKKRKYDGSNIQFGFTSSGDWITTVCRLCRNAVKSFDKTVFTRRHLQTKHANLKGQSLSFFQHKLKDLKQRQKSIEALSQNTNYNSLQASVRVSYLITKQAKPHTIGENLILPAAKKIVKCMNEEKMARELDVIPMSNTRGG
ncbi:Zinc finger BED domain-containing protein 5 [Eumeta japonica]|uniref:Zinc finger BED domain-containing protein 5 n=1 Tax=Eumeta variegata TaxID=151549 RepID=A0A4C1UYF5_EUMVA|nr:Zinc finger BED domain-containing protein 5 [Eumeta japonica]